MAWKSKLQSTMEAEIHGCIQCYTRVDPYVDPITLYMDSKSAMSLAKNPTHHKRSKHRYIKYHWLREHTYEEGTIHLEHCGTEEHMVADVLTKALAFEFHV